MAEVLAILIVVGFVLGPPLWMLYWGLACWYVAREKDRNALGWGIAGFFLWFFAFLPLAVVPDLTEYEDSDA